ncbi:MULTISPECIES: LytTR family DNA-binding domain-containing protein [unclassified Methylophilus]|uniref:LytR/AlgR family response regulator transcription factor n=1 Tax=unclassified Methylophilus TaxID=2630143 RepID=UPI0006F56AFB|nr:MULTISPECIES: LytTR family DNA-binding domain-containing protein [unclassified Methylophilus]KQT41324.1 two-component system response regulator [Methylophilus sp. Leaf416]KQT57845.1 two-component system response regulator [Methylophilus sp. Leaf459]
MARQQLLIVDDEPLARQRLRDLVGDIGGYTVVGEAANGLEAMAVLQNQQVDIALVDIRMPVMDGIELAQHIRQLPRPPNLIFTTAYDHYALQAFDLNAIDYLLKPIRAERLSAALTKARPLNLKQSQGLQSLQETRQHLSIHERGRVLLIAVDEVLYFRAELKYVTVRTQSKSYLLEMSLNQLEQNYADRFVRVHRNALVAKHAITGYEKQRIQQNAETEEPGELSWVVLIKGIPETLVVSRRHQHMIRAV